MGKYTIAGAIFGATLGSVGLAVAAPVALPAIAGAAIIGGSTGFFGLLGATADDSEAEMRRQTDKEEQEKKNEEQKKINKFLLASNKTKTKEIENLEVDKKKQEETNEALKKKQKELDKINETLLIDNKQQKEINENLSTDNKNSKEEISNLKADNKQQKEINETLLKKDKEKDIKISNLENETERLKNEIESLNAQIQDLKEQNKFLIQKIEKFKSERNKNFNERISFNEKKIVEIFKLLKQTEEIFKKIQETTSFYINKNFELNQNLQERKDSIKSEEIMVMSDHSNQNSLIQTSDDEFYVFKSSNETNQETKDQDSIEKENEEEKKKEELKKIEEQKDLLCIPQTKMIFELTEEIRNNQIEANKTREEKVNVISNDLEVKKVLSRFEIPNNLEKEIVFVK